MRDEDPDRPSEEDDRTEDKDFDPITGGDSTKKPGGDSNRLSDRRIPVIEESSLPSENQRLESSDRPSTQPTYRTSSVATASTVLATDHQYSVSPVEPSTNIESSTEETEADWRSELSSTVQSVGVGSSEHPPTQSISDCVRLQDTLPEQTESLGVSHQTTLTTDDQRNSQTMTPESHHASNRPELTPETLDPGFRWTGGVPYATTTPQCILHVSPSEFESLAFLQRVLRDTYTELEGGRPQVQTLSTRAGTLNRVSVHGSIVTLDLTEEVWTVSLDRDQVTINHENRSVVPELQDYISAMYGGKLGYFVINASEADLKSPFHTDGEDRLVSSLLDASDLTVEEEENDESLYARNPPIRIAAPRFSDESEFRSVVEQYFGFSISEREEVDGRIEDVEAAQETRLRANDWRRVALTERQNAGDGESDEHYLWKAALVDGIAWQMKEQYRRRNDGISFSSFVKHHLLRTPTEEPIQTEYELDVDDSDVFADILVSADKTWAWGGLTEFFERTPIEPSKGSEVAIEFETGRGEGAFNLRKLRETVDKYLENEDTDICVVVPPRMFFRSESRGRMMKQLVDASSMDRSSQEFALCVPELGRRTCDYLVSSESILEEWFGDSDEE